MDHCTKVGINILIFNSVLVVFANGMHFQFPESDPCEIIDIDATFSLRYDDGLGQSEDAPLFSLAGALVHNQSSTCDDPDLDHLLNLDLYPSGERLSLNFQINETNGNVKLFVYFRMDPSKHFKDLNESSVIMADSTHLPVGDTSHSYRCVSDQIISFNNDSSFYMNMTIRNVQLQAYNVNGSQYSPAVECSLDMVTTEEPTSEMTSSQTPATTSQEPMTSMPTSHIVTSSPTEPPNPRLHFEVKNGSIVCLVLDGVFSFMIPYMKKDNTIGNAVISVPQDAVSYGSSCADADSQFLQIIFFNTSNKPWSFDINIQKSDKTEAQQGYAAEGDVTYSWRNVGLTYYIDSHFDDAKDTSGDVQSASSGDLMSTFQATSSGSYKCDKEQNIGMGNITLTVSKLQYRAFGTTKSDKYPTENVIDCSSPGKKNDTGKMIGIIVGSLCGGIVVIAFVVYLLVRYKKRKNYSELKEPL